MTAPDLPALARAWQLEGRRAIVIEVTATAGSVPREAGTRMLVSIDDVAGTIGGGRLEWVAIEHARGLLAGRPLDAERRLPLGPALGQCCGGTVALRFEALAAADVATWHAAPPRFELQLHGAGHVGRAIARLLGGLPCRVAWIDSRDDAFPDEPSPPHVQRLAVDTVEAEVALAPPGAFFVVLTHSHDVDLAVAEAVLRRGDFGYLGVIGSTTKRTRFVRRLEQRGLPPERLQRLTCPIGLPGIAGKEPEVIAVAVVAQLLRAAAPAAATHEPRSKRAPVRPE